MENLWFPLGKLSTYGLVNDPFSTSVVVYPRDMSGNHGDIMGFQFRGRRTFQQQND